MPPDTRLLVRVDDAGSSWSSNMGCLQACTDGIARSVEVMMPGSWVPHAATEFAKHPNLDIGVHLTLSSEWDAVKWRPLTQAPTLTDAEGYFLPLVLPRAGDDRPCLAQTSFDLNDILHELEAQIESALRLFTSVSHISAHMIRHFKELDPRLGPALSDLCHRFGIVDDAFGNGMPRVSGYPAFPRDGAARAAALVKTLSGLPPGDHIFIDHPAVLSPELSMLGHAGYEDVSDDRAGCLAALTDPAVAACIQEMGIRLIGYSDL